MIWIDENNMENNLITYHFNNMRLLKSLITPLQCHHEFVLNEINFIEKKKTKAYKNIVSNINTPNEIKDFKVFTNTFLFSSFFCFFFS